MKHVVYALTLFLFSLLLQAGGTFSPEEKLKYVFASGQSYEYGEPRRQLINAGREIQPNEWSPTEELPRLLLKENLLTFSTVELMNRALEDLKKTL